MLTKQKDSSIKIELRKTRLIIGAVTAIILAFALLSSAFSSVSLASTAKQTKDQINIVFDEANLFTKAEKENLNKFSETNFNSFGVVVAVATIDEIPAGQTMKSWTLNKANELGVGSSKKNNGLFYGIAVDDREYFVAKGSGFSSVSESQLDSILKSKLVPEFKKENYAQGVMSSASAFGSYLKYQVPAQKEYDTALQSSFNESMKKILLTLVGFIVIISGVTIPVYVKKRKKAAKIKAIKDSARDNINLLSDKDLEEYSDLPSQTTRREFLNQKRFYSQALNQSEYSEVSEDNMRIIEEVILEEKYLDAKVAEDESIKVAYAKHLVKLDEIAKEEQARQDARTFWNELPYSDRKALSRMDQNGRERWLNERYNSGHYNNSLFTPTNILLFMAINSLANDLYSSENISTSSSDSYNSSSFGGGSFSGGSGGSW